MMSATEHHCDASARPSNGSQLQHPPPASTTSSTTTQQQPRFGGFVLGGAQKAKARPALAAAIVPISEPLADGEDSAPPSREFIAARSVGGGVELSSGAQAATDSFRRRLVIPLGRPAPPPLAAENTTLTAGAADAKSLDELAKESLLADLHGTGSGSRAATGPMFVIPAVVAATPLDAAAAVGANNHPPSDRAAVADRHRDVDPDLLARLFNPAQKRVTGDPSAPPILSRGRSNPANTTAGGSEGESETAKFSSDVASRPANLSETSDAYERVPIGEFGAAMLRGMGVAESVLSLSDSSATDTAEGEGGGILRQARQGLGASSGARAVMQAISGKADKWPKHLKPGDTRAPPPTLEQLISSGPAAGGGSGGKTAASASIRARKFPGIVNGAVVTVAVGRHTGKLALVSQTDNVPGLEKARIRVCLRGKRDAYGLSHAQSADDTATAAATAAADVNAVAAPAVTVSQSSAGVRSITWNGLSDIDTDVVIIGKSECRVLSTAEVESLPPMQRAEIAFLTAVEDGAREAERAQEKTERMALEKRLREEDEARVRDAKALAKTAASAAAAVVDAGVERQRANEGLDDAEIDDDDHHYTEPVRQQQQQQLASSSSSSTQRAEAVQQRRVDGGRGELDSGRDHSHERGNGHSSSSSRGQQHRKRSRSRDRGGDDNDISRSRSQSHRTRDRGGDEQQHQRHPPDASSSRSSQQHHGRHYDESHEHRPSEERSHHHRHHQPSDDDSRTGRESSSHQRESSGPSSWLRTGIRVRIVDERSSSYSQKGVIRSIPRHGVACVVVDTSSTSSSSVSIELEVPQRHLETALPKAGGPVLIVSGRYANERGTLVERDSGKGVATVRLSTSGPAAEVSIAMDDVAEAVARVDR